jgi:hypothetical protein
MRSLSLAGLFARYTPERANTKQRALAPNRQGFVRAIEHLSTIRRAHLPDLRAKKIPLHRELPDLGVQLLDLALARRLGVEPHARVESSRCVPQKLLLPGVNLVRVDLVAQRQISNRRLLTQSLQGDLRLHARVDLASRLLGHGSLRLS